MKTRIATRCLVGAVATSLSFSALAQAAPNIVYIMADDQRADAAGFMGNTIIQTPTLDALASQGVVFDNTFVTTAICMTNRASVFTGQYSSQHGVQSFNTNLTESQLNNSYLGQLSQAGYYTGFVGKWGVGDPDAAAVNNILDYNTGFGGQGNFNTTDANGDPIHLTALLAQESGTFIKQAAGQNQPFLLTVSFKAPHAQDPNDFSRTDPAFDNLYVNDTIPAPVNGSAEFFNAQPDFIRNSEGRDRWKARHPDPATRQETVKDYYRLVSGIDAAVADIRASLEDPNGDGDFSDSVADNTVIIYTSDHGLFMGDRGLAGKWLAHEQSIKVPLVIHDPRNTDEHGTRVDEMALSIDMASTILDLAGITEPTGMQGKSLAGFTDGSAPEDWRSEFFYEHLFNHNEIPKSEAVRTEQYKYISYIGEDFEELYDLTADPNESVNLAGDAAYADVLGDMRLKLDAWRELAGNSDTLPNLVEVPEPSSMLLLGTGTLTLLRRSRR